MIMLVKMPIIEMIDVKNTFFAHCCSCLLGVGVFDVGKLRAILNQYVLKRMEIMR